MSILIKSVILTLTCALPAALLCGSPAGAGPAAAPPALAAPAAAAPAAVAPSPAAQSTPEAARELDGTLRSVDATARSLGLITGVGHALRLAQISVDKQCKVLRAGAAASLRDLKPGDVVHVRVRRTAGRTFAESIEVQSAGGAQ